MVRMVQVVQHYARACTRVTLESGLLGSRVPGHVRARTCRARVTVRAFALRQEPIPVGI
jgi:hypothetical protein